MKIGLIPGWGGTQRLTRLIGPALAAEMICAGEPPSAERACQLGIVFDVVPRERLLDEAVRLLQWARQTGDWQEARRRKQQPVGLTEEQLGFTFAVTRAQVLRPRPAATIPPRWPRWTPSPRAAICRWKTASRWRRRHSCRWSAARSRAT